MRRDLVYRDEIMDSLVKEYNRKRTNDGLKLAWIEKAVNDVKPAPIDLHDTNVGDMISRSSLLEKYDKEHEGPPGRARKLIEEEPPAQRFFRWIPCSVINQCFIPELKNVEYAGMLFTYRTPKGMLRVRETWIERGRIVGKKMNGTPIAYMSLPEPYKGVTE